MDEIFYTLQIHYTEKDKVVVKELKDLHCPPGKERVTWMNEIRSKLYTTGFNISTTKYCTRFVSPYLVLDAFLIEQPDKFGI